MRKEKQKYNKKYMSNEAFCKCGFRYRFGECAIQKYMYMMIETKSS